MTILRARPARSLRSPREWNPLTLAVITGVWLAVLPNWPLWHALARLPETASMRGTGFVVAFGVMIASLTTALLCLVAWRATIKPAANFLIIAAAIGAHFMGSYGGVIDTTMMTSTLETNLREVGDMVNPRLVVDLLVLAVLPIAFVTRLRLKALGPARQGAINAAGFVTAILLTGALMSLFFADFSSTMRNHRSVRYLINPANSLYALVDLGLAGRYQPAAAVPRAIGLDARALARAPGTRPPLVLLVVGETARADHFSLNGYARPTNAELARQDVVSFSAVTSCGTSTAASLPCMFSPLGKAAFEAHPADDENLLDLVQRAGYAVLWVDNQAGCKKLCSRIPNAFAIDPAPGQGALPAELCGQGECLDEALLLGLDARLAELPATRRDKGVLIVLHQMGSHGPAYFKRSPPTRKPFLPECTTSVLQQCDRQALVNAYDNSIAYTDHVLAGAVQWLMQHQDRYDVSLTYLSDHGESLGGNGIYLHGLPYTLAPKEQTHVPMIVWLGAQALRDPTISVTCLRGRRGRPLSHDNLFHSIVGLLGIQASEYRQSLDAFAPCRVQQ